MVRPIKNDVMPIDYQGDQPPGPPTPEPDQPKRSYPEVGNGNGNKEKESTNWLFWGGAVVVVGTLIYIFAN